MALRRRNDEPVINVPPQVEEKILDVSATMQGALRFDDPVNLRISGKFEGTLDTKGKLMIGNKADIKANITGEEIHIDGNVSGNIKASKLLKLSRTARLNGDVETARISIEEGALIVGQVRMENRPQDNNAADNIFADPMNVSQVAEYLEVEPKKVREWATTGILPGTASNGDWFFQKSKLDEWISSGRIKS